MSVQGLRSRYSDLLRADGLGIQSRCERNFPYLPYWPWRPPKFLYNGYRISFREVQWPRRGVDHPHHLSPRLKKEYIYSSTPRLGLHGLFWGELYLLPVSGTDWLVNGIWPCAVGGRRLTRLCHGTADMFNSVCYVSGFVSRTQHCVQYTMIL